MVMVMVRMLVLVVEGTLITHVATADDYLKLGTAGPASTSIVANITFIYPLVVIEGICSHRS